MKPSGSGAPVCRQSREHTTHVGRSSWIRNENTFQEPIWTVWSGSCAKHNHNHDDSETVYGLNSVAFILSIMSAEDVDVYTDLCINMSTTLEIEQKTAERNLSKMKTAPKKSPSLLCSLLPSIFPQLERL